MVYLLRGSREYRTQGSGSCPDRAVLSRVLRQIRDEPGAFLGGEPMNRPDVCAYCFQNQCGRCDGFRYTWPPTLSKSLCACALNDHGRLYP